MPDETIIKDAGKSSETEDTQAQKMERRKIPENMNEFNPDRDFTVSKKDGIEKSLIITMANMMILNKIADKKCKSEFVNNAIQEYAANHFLDKIDERLIYKKPKPVKAVIAPFYRRLFAIFGAKLLNPNDLQKMLEIINESRYSAEEITEKKIFKISKELSEKSKIHTGNLGRPYWAVALNLYKYGYDLKELLNDSSEPPQQLEQDKSV